jgi:hypothetical protein
MPRDIPALRRASYGVDLICKVREYLTLAQIGQLMETLMLHGAPEMQDLLLQLGLLPRPSRRGGRVSLSLPVSPCVSPEVFQKRGIGGR